MTSNSILMILCFNVLQSAIQTSSSSSKHNFNAARRLQKVQNTKRIIESHKKQLVAEKNKLKKVYEHTVDELNSERRQHDIMQHTLKQKSMDLQNIKHENSLIRAKLRQLHNESENWKKQALQVTTSLQQHVHRVKEEKDELALQNESPLLFSLQVLLGSNRKLSFARA